MGAKCMVSLVLQRSGDLSLEVKQQQLAKVINYKRRSQVTGDFPPLPLIDLDGGAPDQERVEPVLRGDSVLRERVVSNEDSKPDVASLLRSTASPLVNTVPLPLASAAPPVKRTPSRGTFSPRNGAACRAPHMQPSPPSASSLSASPGNSRPSSPKPPPGPSTLSFYSTPSLPSTTPAGTAALRLPETAPISSQPPPAARPVVYGHAGPAWKADLLRTTVAVSGAPAAAVATHQFSPFLPSSQATSAQASSSQATSAQASAQTHRSATLPPPPPPPATQPTSVPLLERQRMSHQSAAQSATDFAREVNQQQQQLQFWKQQQQQQQQRQREQGLQQHHHLPPPLQQVHRHVWKDSTPLIVQLAPPRHQQVPLQSILPSQPRRAPSQSNPNGTRPLHLLPLAMRAQQKAWKLLAAQCVQDDNHGRILMGHLFTQVVAQQEADELAAASTTPSAGQRASIPVRHEGVSARRESQPSLSLQDEIDRESAVIEQGTKRIEELKQQQQQQQETTRLQQLLQQQQQHHQQLAAAQKRFQDQQNQRVAELKDRFKVVEAANLATFLSAGAIFEGRDVGWATRETEEQKRNWNAPTRSGPPPPPPASAAVASGPRCKFLEYQPGVPGVQNRPFPPTLLPHALQRVVPPALPTPRTEPPLPIPEPTVAIDGGLATLPLSSGSPIQPAFPLPAKPEPTREERTRQVLLEALGKARPVLEELVRMAEEGGAGRVREEWEELVRGRKGRVERMRRKREEREEFVVLELM